MNENENQPQDVQSKELIQEDDSWKKQFSTLIKFSKYLAVVLFVSSPFVGFWLVTEFQKESPEIEKLQIEDAIETEIGKQMSLFSVMPNEECKMILIEISNNEPGELAQLYEKLVVEKLVVISGITACDYGQGQECQEREEIYRQRLVCMQELISSSKITKKELQRIDGSYFYGDDDREQNREYTFDGRIQHHTGHIGHTNHRPSLEEISKRQVYINPKITKNQSNIVFPGMAQEYYKPDHIERSFQENTWYEDDPDRSPLSNRQQRHQQLAQIASLHIGTTTPIGTRVIANSIDSTDENLFLVQVRIQEFSEVEKCCLPNDEPWILAEDYECNLATLTCIETDILKKGDAHMAANDINSKTAQFYSFWKLWNREFNNVVGFLNSEGAHIEAAYMYHPSRDGHTKIDTTDIDTIILSPSKRRLMVLHSGNNITTHDLQDDFVLVQDADLSNLKGFFRRPYRDNFPPLFKSDKKLWSQDESTVYFVQDQRIFVHDITTGITDRLLDATSLFDLPVAHADSIDNKVYSSSDGPKLSKSGRYLYYKLVPNYKPGKNIHVIIDLLDQYKSKEFIADQRIFD